MKRNCKFLVLGIVISLTAGMQAFAGNNAATAAVNERYATAKQIAAYHSAGLEYVYNILKGDGQILKNLYNADEKQRAEILLKITAEYVSKSDVKATLERLSKSFPTQDAGNFKNTNAPKSANYFDGVVDNIANENLREDAFTKAMNSKEFTAFSEPEQNDILLMFAIYADSYQYWNGNLKKWIDLSISAVGKPTDPQINLISWGKLGKADAKGAIAGFIAGAITGVGAGGSALFGGIGNSVLNLLDQIW
ncbi:MAG: hypothetical protein FWD66_03110 [Paludibacter sp.]|nr:hypothetical protein [Paludibacter sp.]